MSAQGFIHSIIHPRTHIYPLLYPSEHDDLLIDYPSAHAYLSIALSMSAWGFIYPLIHERTRIYPSLYSFVHTHLFIALFIRSCGFIHPLIHERDG